MADREDNADPRERIRLVNATGSPVTLGHRDRVERVREAIVDLRVAIDGCVAQSPDRLSDSVASLARHCSIFLRKMVLGDERSPRLLDGDFCQMAELGFNRISKVPTNRRTLTLVPIDIARGYFQATKLDEETSEPEYTEVIPIGPQRLTIDIEWPLPGMTYWLEQPVQEAPWDIRVEGLFESQSDQVLNCEPWLGQQLVMFDNRGITLRDVIRVTVNTEAAHSPPLDRLMLPEGDEDKARFRVVKDREIHILSYITVCGVRYSHAIVIQAALFLYRKLAGNGSISRSEGEVGIPVFGFIPYDVFSPNQDWLRFDGGLVTSLGGRAQTIAHRVRAPRG